MQHLQRYFQNQLKAILNSQLAPYIADLPHIHSSWLTQCTNAKTKPWQAITEKLPFVNDVTISLGDTVTVERTDISPNVQAQLANMLPKLMPWRKGPFQIFSTFIDTEWRSDWKWQRLANEWTNLAGQTILDVGCGSGYHLWRMRQAGADFVLGIDPTDLFFYQYLTLQHFIQDQQVQYLPIGLESLPARPLFDSVFCMGVLYHRRDPLAFLTQLKQFTKPGGHLYLETLIIEGDEQTCLIPSDRYAQMSNVWFLPSLAMLKLWLTRLGWQDIEVLDINQTSVDEQRATTWIEGQSLVDFLDPQDPNKTIEGYPAPRRAMLKIS